MLLPNLDDISTAALSPFEILFDRLMVPGKRGEHNAGHLKAKRRSISERIGVRMYKVTQREKNVLDFNAQGLIGDISST